MKADEAGGWTLSGARVLVTGAGGFVGRRLVAALIERGAEVDALLPPARAGAVAPELAAARVAAVDVTDGAALHRVVEAARPDVAFNLAVARGDGSPPARTAAVRTNVGGIANLLAATADRPLSRLVQLGGPLEYGPSDRPLAESEPARPTSFYGATKAAATALCLRAHARGARVAVLRPFFVYGPGQAPTRLIPRAIAAARSGAALPLTAAGLGRDWVFVDDVVDACLAAATAPAAVGEVINVGSGRRWSNEDVVRAVGDVVGRAVAVRPGAEPERPWDRHAWVADVRKAWELLGWRARHGLHEGLERTAAATAPPPPAETAATR